MSRRAGEETRVEVEEGLVEVQHDGNSEGPSQLAARQVLQVRGGERVRLHRLQVFRERFVGPQGRLERFVRAAREWTERLRELPPERRFQLRREEVRERLRERRNRRQASLRAPSGRGSGELVLLSYQFGPASPGRGSPCRHRVVGVCRTAVLEPVNLLAAQR